MYQKYNNIIKQKQPHKCEVDCQTTIRRKFYQEYNLCAESPKLKGRCKNNLPMKLCREKN